MSRPFHRLTPDDREWALDHGRRRYRVRRARAGDLASDRQPAACFVTVVRLDDGARLVLAETCLAAVLPFADSDEYAAHRLALVNHSRRQRGEMEV